MSKTVLITGAAVRIGREIALSLADEGWDVAIHYSRSEKQAEELAALIKQKKRKAFLAQGDLRDPKSVANIIPSLSRQGVKLNCLINNASAFEKDTIRDMTQESWQEHIDVNLFAPLRLIQDFVTQYNGKNGNIINITDGLKDWSISPAFFSYSISKIGLENATELLAKDLAPDIRINAIAPGPTMEGKQDKADTFDKLKKVIPLRRTSSLREICDAVRYILSTPSLTGQVISLSGGM